MRLIDADKLYPDCVTKYETFAISQSQIAAAPTVPMPDFKAGYKQAILDGKTNFSRPQGEWKETGYEMGALGITYRQTQCSNCGWEHALPIYYNFCPNCGADMKGDRK